MENLLELAKDINVELVKAEPVIDETKAHVESATQNIDEANAELEKKRKQLE